MVFVFDPFFVYHKPIANLKEVQKIYQYQVPGVLRNFDYDGVLLGSSVVMSINADDLAKKYQCKKVVKAVASSSPASTLKYFLDLSLDSHDVKYIFYGMDVFSFHKAPHNTGMPEEVAFIINKNPFDDVGYIWNGDILAVKIPDMIRTSMNPDYDPGMAYGFMQWTPTGTKRVLDNYNPLLTPTIPMKDEMYQFDMVKENIRALDEKIKQYPNTKFILFTPCYSVLWWDRAYRDGLYNAYLHTLDYAFSTLLKNQNVEIYAVNFNNAEYITDLSDYADPIHGSLAITRMMTESLGDQEQRITLDNYKQHIEQLDEAVVEFMDRVNNEGIDFLYQE